MGRKDDTATAAGGADAFNDTHAPAGIPEFYEGGGDDTLMTAGEHELVVTAFAPILGKERALKGVRIEAVRTDGEPGTAIEKFFIPAQVDAWKAFATKIGARERGKAGIPTRAETYVGKKFRAVVSEYDDFIEGSRIKRVVGVV